MNEDPGFTLTPRAWLLLAVAAALGLTGRVLGIAELFPLAATCAALVGVSAAAVRFLPLSVAADRSVVPARVHIGTPARVDLRLTAEAATGVLTVRDPFDGGRRWARFRVAPMRAGQSDTAAYRVPTERRGMFPVGPLTVERSDPLGLAVRAVAIAGQDTLTVYPQVHHIAPLPYTRGDDPRGGTTARPALGASGEEFYALRPYVMGDDLRRVHWPSSAKLDDLLIRQDELPWQGRATVVVDLRPAIHTPESFETAMSVAASICVACAGAGLEVRLLGSDGADSGSGSGRHHVEDVLERLAAWNLATVRNHTMVAALASATLGRQSAVAVVSTDRAAPADLEAAARGRGRPPIVVLVGDGRGPAPGGVRLVRVRDLSRFAAAWEQACGPAPRHRRSGVLA